MENRIKIALVGYGSMGKEIERISDKTQFEIVNIFDEFNPINPNENYSFDVAIDFTHPTVVMDNIKTLAKLGKNMVIGTTGWLDKLDEAKAIVEKYPVGLIYGSNFSVGMHMFMMISEYAAKLANKFEDYDIFMHELHHKRKKDSPSGTALSLANMMISNIDRKSTILDQTINRQIESDELHVTSTRGGEIPGTHTIYIDSLADTLELTHRARNRSGFASGSLIATKLIAGKKGVYDFYEMIKNI